MNDLNTDTGSSDHTHTYSKPDLNADDFRFAASNEPISTGEYIKLLGYCMLALVGVGVFIFLLSYIVS